MSRLSRTKTTPINHRTELMNQLLFLGQMQSTETAHFHATAAAKNGTNITDSKTISVLLQEGPMTAGELATRLSLTTGAVTSRLEDAGLAHRLNDPEDRRKVIVKVDKTKLARMGRTYASMGKAFQELLENYSTEELEFLVQFYLAAIELTKSETAKL
jgi:DNA-binding MarR family transcriptional regulator